MKVLGVNTNSYQPTYIVELAHDEYLKIMTKAIWNTKLEFLKCGQEVDITIGYNFRNDIVSATEKMQQAHESFAEASKTMTKFIGMLPKAEAS